MDGSCGPISLRCLRTAYAHHPLCYCISTSPAEEVRMHGIGPSHMIGEGHDMKEVKMELPLVPTASTIDLNSYHWIYGSKGAVK